jgi:lysophospholipase L1-like esterase
VSVSSFQRYVAIGDSQTEGLHDYANDGHPRGWADRFAEQLAQSNPEMLYANLAVRGKRVSEICRDQLHVALDLSPDLATVVGGVNDVLRPGVEVADVVRDLDTMYAALTDSGCTVIGCTFPLPSVGLTKRVAPRLQSLNAAIRAAATRRGALVVDLEGIPMASDLRLWDADRIHLNPDGHRRLAGAFEATLRGGSDARWREALPPAPDRSTPERVLHEAAWIARYLLPKIVRLARGRSSGDGRIPKRPHLTRVSSTPTD